MKKSIVQALTKEADQNGICDEWKIDLSRIRTVDGLCKMYLDGIDFCLSNEYPSVEFLRENFAGMTEKHGIFVDKKCKVEGYKKIVLLGDSDANIAVSGYQVVQVFVKHQSKLSLKATDNTFAIVDMFDNSQLDIELSGNSKVCIMHYGGVITRTLRCDDAMLKIENKNKKTY